LQKEPYAEKTLTFFYKIVNKSNLLIIFAATNPFFYRTFFTVTQGLSDNKKNPRKSAGDFLLYEEFISFQSF